MANTVAREMEIPLVNVRMVGGESTATVRVLNQSFSKFWFNMYYLVCQTNDACIGFPLVGGIESSFDDSTLVNMTCYKGGQTVFNNHQMCDVTSTFLLILKNYVLF
jgi:hypothetical protein